MADASAASPGPAAAETPTQQRHICVESVLRRKVEVQLRACKRSRHSKESNHQRLVPNVGPRRLTQKIQISLSSPSITTHLHRRHESPSPFAFDGNATSAIPQFPQAQGDPSQDPMMAMLQQMMGTVAGGMPGAQGQPGPPGDLPPGLANMFSAMGGAGVTPEPSPEQSSAWIWRLVHSVFSLGLALYIVVQTLYTGSKLSRDTALTTFDEDWSTANKHAQSIAHFFYLFVTFEVIMQSSRYFIEQCQLHGKGILSTVAGFLPPPYSRCIRTLGSYGIIYTTLVSDAMIIVFVLGATV